LKSSVWIWHTHLKNRLRDGVEGRPLGLHPNAAVVLEHALADVSRDRRLMKGNSVAN
jgi:hypothetical protein